MVKKVWKIIGLMSGTSLDGLDIALCEFVTQGDDLVDFKILKAETIGYTGFEVQKLTLKDQSAELHCDTDFWFGRFCGEKVRRFLESANLKADLVASHGHTIFHQPQNGFTIQIGNGAALSAMCQLPVVSDFRSMDVALGGQGAPLVPMGDLILFRDYSYCLNLGGIANITTKIENILVAYDICPVNMALNYLAQETGQPYDLGGNMARSGKVNVMLLEQMQQLEYYSMPFPKSLGKEWFEKCFRPVLDHSTVSTIDKMATVVEHISLQIAKSIVVDVNKPKDKMLITGGGAFNTYLIEIFQKKLSSHCKLHVPDASLVSYKEALIFAFLGMLRVQNKNNAIKTVTGASIDNIGGALYGNFQHLLNKQVND